MERTRRPPGDLPETSPGSPCPHVSSSFTQNPTKSRFCYTEANNHPLLLQCSKKRFAQKTEKKRPISPETSPDSPDLTGDLAGDPVAKKMCYCSKIGFAGDIDRDLVGNIVAKTLSYCSKTHNNNSKKIVILQHCSMHTPPEKISGESLRRS